MSEPGAIVVIPARLASSRLPRKVLADIGGRPMIWHVYQRCLQAKRVNAVCVATDSEEVAREVRSWGGQAFLTDEAHPSGTARIASIAHLLGGDPIVNVQGDEPLIEPSVIDQVVEAFESASPKPDIVTPVFRMTDREELFSPSLVKVVRRRDGYALYFSRSPIPHVRDMEDAQWLGSATFWGHIGIYGFRRQVLLDYPLLLESPLEEAEKLEQLRFLEAGRSILTVVTDYRPMPVDVPADLERVRALARGTRALR